jgi:hypothetical protein
MALTGLAETAASIALIGAIWLAGLILIKAAEVFELRHAAAVRVARHKRRKAAAQAPPGRRA